MLVATLFLILSSISHAGDELAGYYALVARTDSDVAWPKRQKSELAFKAIEKDFESDDLSLVRSSSLAALELFDFMVKQRRYSRQDEFLPKNHHIIHHLVQNGLLSSSLERRDIVIDAFKNVPPTLKPTLILELVSYARGVLDLDRLTLSLLSFATPIEIVNTLFAGTMKYSFPGFPSLLRQIYPIGWNKIIKNCCARTAVNRLKELLVLEKWEAAVHGDLLYAFGEIADEEELPFFEKELAKNKHIGIESQLLGAVGKIHSPFAIELLIRHGLLSNLDEDTPRRTSEKLRELGRETTLGFGQRAERYANIFSAGGKKAVKNALREESAQRGLPESVAELIHPTENAVFIQLRNIDGPATSRQELLEFLSSHREKLFELYVETTRTPRSLKETKLAAASLIEGYSDTIPSVGNSPYRQTPTNSSAQSRLNFFARLHFLPDAITKNSLSWSDRIRLKYYIAARAKQKFGAETNIDAFEKEFAKTMIEQITRKCGGLLGL